MFSEHQGTPSFAGNPRRNSALVRAEGDDARVDWSNLTSGPGGPTVSDPAPVHAGVSGIAFPVCAFDVYIFETFPFLFLFYLKKQILTRTLTGYNFLITTPNEMILFPISLKFDLVYFKIYLIFF